MNIFQRVWAVRGKLIDPDRAWFSGDKYQHGASMAAVGFLMAICGRDFFESMRDAAVISVVYELGQTDTAFSTGKLGQPGYGISPLDLTWDMAGAVVGYVAGVLVR